MPGRWGAVDDPSILFEADRKDDWRDEDLWRRVNPGLKHATHPCRASGAIPSGPSAAVASGNPSNN